MLNPNYANPYYNMASMFYKVQDKFDEAVEAYKKSIVTIKT